MEQDQKDWGILEPGMAHPCEHICPLLCSIGGAGSGYFGHPGRPGLVGGSVSTGTKQEYEPHPRAKHYDTSGLTEEERKAKELRDKNAADTKKTSGAPPEEPAKNPRDVSASDRTDALNKERAQKEAEKEAAKELSREEKAAAKAEKEKLREQAKLEKAFEKIKKDTEKKIRAEEKAAERQADKEAREIIKEIEAKEKAEARERKAEQQQMTED